MVNPAVRVESHRMRTLLTQWAAINSGSNNAVGLKRMVEALCDAFADLPGYHEIIECPGTLHSDVDQAFSRYALRIRRKADSGRRPVLLNGHYDTVYGAGHPFQHVQAMDGDRLHGPGVTDMKGGLVVILTALRIWEASEYAGRLGWEVLITPDEEIGSPCSLPLLKEAAAACSVGLVYESAYLDGGFVRSRMGSGTYTISVKGRAAHVGRNFDEGINAIVALCQSTAEVDRVARDMGIIANAGQVAGGGALNVVPDHAALTWNVRAESPADFERFESALDALVARWNQADCIAPHFEWRGGINKPPKTVDAATGKLFSIVEQCARRVGLPVSWRDTGGGSDGSHLAAFGLPNIDNLGVRGGAIHSDQEFIVLSSLEERVALTLEILETLAEV